jgi:diguanylate cyclase (GGDEF)-like protein/PAS domain S-box-containing protein
MGKAMHQHMDQQQGSTLPARAGEADSLRRLLIAQQAIASSLADLAPTADLFDQLLSTVCGTLGWSFGAAWQLDRDAERLTCSAVWNATGLPEVGDFGAASLEQRFERGRGLPGYVWATGAPTWVSDLVWDPRIAATARAQRAGLRSAVALPLGSGAGFCGVLELFSTDERDPDGEQLVWLSVVAAQVGQYLARWNTHETLLGRDRALAAAVNGVVIADARRHGFPITYVNPGFTRITGYGAQEMIGRPCSVLQGEGTDAQEIARLKEALSERREVRSTLLNYRKDGTPFWNEVSLSPVVDEAGELVEYIGVQNDVTERRRAEEQAEYLAYHDPLTGLANRALLSKVVERAVDRATRHELQVALVFLDLDRFKEVNDAHGHAAGDALLREVAARLRGAVRPGDLLVRQGGDEFLVLLADLEPGAATAQALDAADRIRASFAAPVAVADGVAVDVRCSVGVSILGRDAHDAAELMRHADIAMYRAKRSSASVKLFQAAAASWDAPAPAASTARAGAAPDVAALDALLAGEGPRSVYQPIVDLEDGTVLAYEALARGPEGSRLERPDQLFGAAQAAGRLGELDWACRLAALRGAEGLERPLRLFVNVEPESLATPCPEHLVAEWERAGRDVDVVVEITERALTARPADLLHLVGEIRARGWGVALDDVGADVRSLALMPLLRPDVIKLDLRLVHEQPSTEVAEIVNAVNAERERTGALVLAEGIESEEHLRTARALGATVGQGWYFGRPAPLPAVTPAPARPMAPVRTAEVLGGADEVSPYEVVRAEREVRRADKRLLLALSMHLEHQAGALGETAVILSAFQDAERFTPLTFQRYTLLGADAAFVAALGVGMASEPAPGVRGAELAAGDPLTGEWSVVVLGPHFAAALVAMDLGDEGPQMARRFDFALTYDRDLVIRAAGALMRRVQPLS